MVFFKAGEVDLERAAAALADDGLTVTHEGGALHTWWDEAGPRLRIWLARGPHVQQEAVEIGRRHGQLPALAPCDARFEIAIDDLAATLDEMNTLIQVQATLQTLTSGMAFNAWNGVLLPPE